MKKKSIFLLIGVIVCMLLACEQRKNIEYNQVNISNNMTATEDVTGDGEEKLSVPPKVADDLIVNELKKLVGEYEYPSNYGMGKLIIKESDYGYDISDYESQSSYRFLADSSNIENIENSRIYIKYPEQVFQDDTVIFSYYILEYSADEIDVYYRQSEHAEEQLLYHATKKNEVLSNYQVNNSPIELYVNVLRNYISAGKTDFAVSFIDLDDDSTREMVVFFGESQTDGAVLFTIRNEEAIQVVAEGTDSFGQYGGFTYKEKGNVFVIENEFVTETQISNQIFYYAMENGKAICKDVTKSIMQFDSDESKFYVNDTEVESEKFNSIAENYGLLEMSTVSYSDGVRVMNEQMDMVYNAYNNK